MDTINRRRFLAVTSCSMAGLASAEDSTSRPKRANTEGPPNLIVIMADDLGAKELGCYGNTVHRTPRLDHLAETGVCFRTCYAAPICHPSRVMIMTGQYGCHNGVYNFAGRRGGPEPGSPAEDMGKTHITFAQMLKARGYVTALGGKWQLSGQLPTMIHECGFDEYCIWAYKHYLPEGVEHTGAWERKDKPSRYWHPSILKNGKYAATSPEDYGPDIYTGFLIDFMKRHRDKPFFLYYPMCLTHAPHLRTPDTTNLEDKKHDRADGRFKGAVEYADKLMGRLVDALDALGLRDNTILFFTGDNGTGGDGKGQPTELGARVPMIINAPGIVEPRGSSNELTDLSDIFPTLADFAGAALPKDRVVDGVSYAPYLLGDTDHMREWIFSFIGDRRILRTQRWLLEDNSPHHGGRLYDCGDSRDGTGYKDVTESDAPEVRAIKKRFNALLATLPAPDIPEDGTPSGKKPPQARKKAARNAAPPP